MAVTFVAAGTATQNVGSGNIASIPLPAGYAVGDALLLLVSTGDNVVSTVTAGWTKKLETNAGTGLRQTIAYKIAASTSETAPTVTHAAGNSGIARIFAFRGTASSGDPFDAASATATTVASTTATAPAITPLSANSAILMVVSGGVVGNTSGTMAPSGYSGTNPVLVEVGDDDGFNGTNEVGIAIAWGIKTDTTTTGGRTATMASSGQSVGTLLAMPAGAAAAVKPPPIRTVQVAALIRAGSM